MPNIDDPDFQEREGAPAGFRAYRARIGYELGSKRIGASVWKLPPGEAAYPYHFHYADEELVFVLSGRPMLRTPAGTRRLEPGEAVHFPLGEEGAHQVLNPTDEEVRFLSVSTSGAPDIVVYPDSNKLGAAERLPEGGGRHSFFDLDSQVDYWEGESAPIGREGVDEGRAN
ncbi:MAG: cupin domain-containing protein [Actinobacteria bacterium]|nr:cupin domain-containing protein [Actinomycetota bacterium]